MRSILAVLVCFTVPLHAQFSKSAAANLELSDGPGLEVQVKLAKTAQGTVYASWFDSDPAGSPAFGYDVRLQRMNASGTELWAAGGVVVADRGFSSTQDYGLCAGPAGDAYLAFRDDRFGGTQITAARVDVDGNLAWGANGVQLTSTTDFVAAPKIAVTPDGTAFVAWTQGSTVRLQRLDGAGATIGSEIMLSQASTSFSLADMRANELDRVVISWISQTGGFFGPRHLYAQSFGTNGVALWTPGGVGIETTGSLQLGNFPPLTSDLAGGAFFTWYTTSPLQCFVQHILANGGTGFGPSPVPVSTDATRIRVGPSLAVDPFSGTPMVFWTEQNSGQSQSGLRVQRFDLSGTRLFGAEGLELIALGSDSIRSVQAAAFPGGARASWIGGAGFGNDLVTSALVTDLGGVLTPYPTLASTPSEKDDLATVTGPFGDVIVAWHGDESGDQGVHAQNVLGSGEIGPAAGTLTRTSPNNVNSYTAIGGRIGAGVLMEVDLAGSGYPLALVVGFAAPASIPFMGQEILVNILGGELLGQTVQAGSLATFAGPVPNDPSLCGTIVYTQAVQIGGGLPLALTNAVDVHLGL